MFLDSLEVLKQSIFELYSNKIFVIAILSFLSIATYTDLKKMIIPNKLNILFVLVRIALIFTGFKLGVTHYLGGILGVAFLLIPAMIKMHKMGGDIKLMGVLGLYLGLQNTLAFLIVTTIYGAVISIPRKLITNQNKNFPFAPFFLATHITFIILQSMIG